MATMLLAVIFELIKLSLLKLTHTDCVKKAVITWWLLFMSKHSSVCAISLGGGGRWRIKQTVCCMLIDFQHWDIEHWSVHKINKKYVGLHWLFAVLF